MDDAIVERLDTLIALTRLAFRESIEAARASFSEDPVSAAILEITEDGWVSAGDLRRRAAEASGQSDRTVARRVAELVHLGALAQDGAGPTVRYRGTGLLG